MVYNAFVCHLNGQEELPPRDTPATGRAHMLYDEARNMLWYELTVKNITNVILAHFHVGEFGKEGDPVPIYTMYRSKPAQGEFEGVLGVGALKDSDLKGPLKGKTISNLVALMKEKRIYLDVHTSDGEKPADTAPGDYVLGEIRGQVLPEKTACCDSCTLPPRFCC